MRSRRWPVPDSAAKKQRTSARACVTMSPHLGLFLCGSEIEIPQWDVLAPLEEKFRGGTVDAKMQVPPPVFRGLLLLSRRTFGRCRFAGYRNQILKTGGY